MQYFAQRYNWRLGWMADEGKKSGETLPGNTGWRALPGTDNVITSTCLPRNRSSNDGHRTLPPCTAVITTGRRLVSTRSMSLLDTASGYFWCTLAL